MEANYKRTVAGSVGSGMGAVLGSGKTYYILEHKNTSKFHQAGEAQKIIVDQIELGRDASCQVRFDESFDTVSRKHAAINRDGENWQLVHLSQSNPTLVNGQPINGTYYLKSGDEIQLSVNGPRLGFIIPQGDKALTSSIAMTERVSLFGKQALRPYRAAIVILSLLLIAVIAGGIYWGMQMAERNDRIDHKIADLANTEVVEENIDPSSNLRDYYSQIYTLKIQKITLEYNGHSIDAGIAVSDLICGTGFMLSDGTFVTARQNVEPWVYAGIVEGDWRETLAAYVGYGCKVLIEYRAYNIEGTAHPLTFTNKDFTIDTSGDSETRKFEVSDAAKTYLGENGINPASETVDVQVVSAKSRSYAYIPGLGSKGLPFDNSRSQNIDGGKNITIVGFKGNTDIHDLEQSISYFSAATSRADNHNGTIVLQDRNANLGFLGSPAFYQEEDGTYRVIGVMVGSYDRSVDDEDRIVPIHILKP